MKKVELVDVMIQFYFFLMGVLLGTVPRNVLTRICLFAFSVDSALLESKSAIFVSLNLTYLLIP